MFSQVCGFRFNSQKEVSSLVGEPVMESAAPGVVCFWYQRTHVCGVLVFSGVRGGWRVCLVWRMSGMCWLEIGKFMGITTGVAATLTPA